MKRSSHSKSIFIYKFLVLIGSLFEFQVILKIIKPINESNILNVASFEVYFPSENLQNMITCKEETS